MNQDTTPRQMHPSGHHHKLLYLFIRSFPDRAVKGLVLAICTLRLLLVGRPTQRQSWNWVLELGDMWPCGLAQPSSQQLLKQPYLQYPLHTRSCQLVVTDQELRVSFRALMQQGDGSGRQRCSVGHTPSHSLISTGHFLAFPLPGEETKRSPNHEGHP